MVAAGALGRSPAYERLLRYLAERAGDSRRPKEIDIAHEVFGRENFDPATDSTVRVYLHNLRQKLDTFYESSESPAGQRLSIPKGNYRVKLVSSPPTLAKPAKAKSRRTLLIIGCVVLVAAAFLLGQMSAETDPDDVDELAQSALWVPMLDDDLPITIVVGDYFVFAEKNQYGMLDRLIRDFGINNKNDFESYVAEAPERSESYQDVRLTYLPTGVGAALNDFLRVPHSARKSVSVVPQSEFAAQTMRTTHIVYIGYLSGMENLSQFAFGASRLRLGASYDELIDSQSNESFTSRAGFITDDESGYVDFGFFSSFPGPAGNQFLFVAGMRDEGLMQMAATLNDPSKIAELLQRAAPGSDGSSGVEALYKVSSLDRTHLSAELLFANTFDASVLWQSE